MSECSNLFGNPTEMVFEKFVYNWLIWCVFLVETADLSTAIQAGTGRFELCLNNKIVLSGNIFEYDRLKFKKNPTASKENDDDSPVVSLSHDEVYSSLEQFGYCVGDSYKTIKHVDIFQDSTHAHTIFFRPSYGDLHYLPINNPFLETFFTPSVTLNFKCLYILTIVWKRKT